MSNKKRLPPPDKITALMQDYLALGKKLAETEAAIETLQDLQAAIEAEHPEAVR